MELYVFSFKMNLYFKLLYYLYIFYVELLIENVNMLRQLLNSIGI